MTKNIYLIGLIASLFLLAACSSSKDSSQNLTETISGNEPTEEENEASLEKKALFTYEEPENATYDIHSVKISNDASTVLFSTVESIKREDERSNYLKYEGNEAIDLNDLSTSDNEEESCRQAQVSPNGQYIILNCLKMDHEFMIYDSQKEEIVHNEPTFENYGSEVKGITNEMEVILRSIDGDILTVYNPEAKESEEYNLPDMTGHESESFDEISITNDGQQLLVDAFYRLYLLDRETGNLEELVNLDSYHEQFDTEDLFLYNRKLSPNGEYAYFEISENSPDPLYQSHNFMNLETGETQSYTDFEYDDVGDIDNNGRILLVESEDLYIHSIPEKLTYQLPNLDFNSTYAGYYTLSGDGISIIYADKESDEVKVNYLYQAALGEVTSYATTDFLAQEENLEKMTRPGMDSSVSSDSIPFSEVNEDLTTMYQKIWNNTAALHYPTEFPEEVNRINYSVGMDTYGQTIRFATDSNKRTDMSFQAFDNAEEDQKESCYNDDLELVETKDGIDYYFYLYNNDEGELSFVKNDWCYIIDGEDFSEEEYLALAYSFAEAGETPHELPIEQVNFPTRLPIEDVIISSHNVYHYASDNTHKYVVSYYGDGENDIAVDLEILQDEPTFYDWEENESIELSNGTEALFNEEHLILFLYDGNYYYDIEADIDNDQLDKLGLEKVKNSLIEVGNSIEL
ncbi:hypothetical protein [Gracilibacillus salinarum]|uniref:Uncharacterized protein n=1 Tax=Gracilibacillus salinarum TaxID=2932255 RepID=A0ABY4GMX9_9BACI|nr:hypothetical protein [Gracilibacillus salinarum]UOQ84712.1 hypothetical protein MUN87_18945 [Gracilibacillus salinarum]